MTAPSPSITRFRNLIFSDSVLAAQLCAITEKQVFVAAVIDIATENGILLSENAVTNEINAGSRTWLERWI